jgi:hypothetical protein
MAFPERWRRPSSQAEQAAEKVTALWFSLPVFVFGDRTEVPR